jgi:uncharacterized protein YecE (DUF72 family)
MVPDNRPASDLGGPPARSPLLRAENDIAVGSSRILVGASSWSDRSLTHESSWYPKKSMRAAERIAYYTARLPLVEIDSTLRFPPTPDVARQWAERTPAGFTIDVQAWSLLTGGATLPDSLWEDMREAVKPEMRDRRRLYAGHLSSAGMAEAWARFGHALRPLALAGRLGVVLFRYPHWLKPGNTGRALLAQARASLPDYRLAVEFQHPDWLAGDACEETLALLDDLGLGFVCVDGSPDSLLPGPVLATSSDVAVVRLYGPHRAPELQPTPSPTAHDSPADPPWSPAPHHSPAAGAAPPGSSPTGAAPPRPPTPAAPPSAPRSPAPGPSTAFSTPVVEAWGARYSLEELAAWVPRILRLAESAREVHVLFANTVRDHAVLNAQELLTALRDATGSG